MGLKDFVLCHPLGGGWEGAGLPHTPSFLHLLLLGLILLMVGLPCLF